MAKTPGGFRAALLIGWIVLGAAGVLYARWKSIPNWAAYPGLAAFLIEYPFYLVPAFPELRRRFAGNRLPVYVLAAAVLPYLACCLGAIEFQWIGLLRVAAFALAVGLWYRVLPHSTLADLAFLAFLPIVLLGKYFESVYVPQFPKFKEIVFLPHVTLIVSAVMVLLVERGVHDPGYGFLPRREDWRIGAMHFLYFLPFGIGLGWLLHATTYAGIAPFWKIAGSFFGFLWTIALSEEFFFWGVLQQWIEEWTWNRKAAMLVTALLFGLVHISFRGFPNWRWVLIAAVLGWFCGRARNQAGSIRAGMVTHALVFTTWRAFFA